MHIIPLSQNRLADTGKHLEIQTVHCAQAHTLSILSAGLFFQRLPRNIKIILRVIIIKINGGIQTKNMQGITGWVWERGKVQSAWPFSGVPPGAAPLENSCSTVKAPPPPPRQLRLRQERRQLLSHDPPGYATANLESNAGNDGMTGPDDEIG